MGVPKGRRVARNFKREVVFKIRHIYNSTHQINNLTFTLLYNHKNTLLNNEVNRLSVNDLSERI